MKFISYKLNRNVRCTDYARMVTWIISKFHGTSSLFADAKAHIHIDLMAFCIQFVEVNQNKLKTSNRWEFSRWFVECARLLNRKFRRIYLFVIKRRSTTEKRSKTNKHARSLTYRIHCNSDSDGGGNDHDGLPVFVVLHFIVSYYRRRHRRRLTFLFPLHIFFSLLKLVKIYGKRRLSIRTYVC